MPNTSQTFRECLQGQADGVPNELVERLGRQVPQGILDAPVSTALAMLPPAVVIWLRDVLDVDALPAQQTREAAAELLSLDALVTYSLEAVASTRGDIDVYAEQLLHTIATVQPEMSA